MVGHCGCAVPVAPVAILDHNVLESAFLGLLRSEDAKIR